MIDPFGNLADARPYSAVRSRPIPIVGSTQPQCGRASALLASNDVVSKVYRGVLVMILLKYSVRIWVWIKWEKAAFARKKRRMWRMTTVRALRESLTLTFLSTEHRVGRL